MKIKKYIAIILCLLIFTISAAETLTGDYSQITSEAEIGIKLGAISLFPTITAVLMAFLLGDVILALSIALILGEMIICFTGMDAIGNAIIHIIPELLKDFVSVMYNVDNLMVLILCAFIGGLVGILVKTKGFDEIANRLSRYIKGPKSANIFAQLFCFIFFFDDYANALISGTVLRPITDKSRISRERLAYIVDSTAAPVAGIAVISSWIAVEISVIGEGLKEAGIERDAFSMMLSSLPYCFYCIFAIVFMLLTSITGREYGPMLKAERRARSGETKKGAEVLEETNNVASSKNTKGLIIAAGTIILLVGLVVTGFIFKLGSTITLLVNASFVCAIVAVASCAVTNLIPISDGINAWLKGAKKILPTIIILILAWALADIVERLGTVYFLVGLISKGHIWQIVPSIVFMCCCVVSFATGSYGCMFMVMPMAIPIAVSVMESASITDERFLLLCISAVLTGGIFGDHCSPMTDCTIMAALGSGCKVMDHTITQMPYALAVALISVSCIFITTAGLQVYFSIAIGIVIMAAIISIFGKKP